MKKNRCFQRAESLLEGERYFLRLPPHNRRIPVFTQVNFIGCTACPAVVIVEDDRNTRFQCDRATLYNLKVE